MLDFMRIQKLKYGIEVNGLVTRNVKDFKFIEYPKIHKNYKIK